MFLAVTWGLLVLAGFLPRAGAAEMSFGRKMVQEAASAAARRPADLVMKEIYFSLIRKPISDLKNKIAANKKTGLSREQRRYIQSLAAIWTGDIIWFMAGTSAYNVNFWNTFLTDLIDSTRVAWIKLLVDPGKNCAALLWRALIPVIKKHNESFEGPSLQALLEVLSDRDAKVLSEWCNSSRTALAKAHSGSGNSLPGLVKQIVRMHEVSGSPSYAARGAIDIAASLRTALLDQGNQKAQEPPPPKTPVKMKPYGTVHKPPAFKMKTNLLRADPPGLAVYQEDTS